MNKKTIIILTICVFVILISIGGYLFWRSNQQDNQLNNLPVQNNTITNTPITNNNVPPKTNQNPTINTDEEKISINTKSGTVSVKDFYKNPQTQVFERGGRYEYAIIANNTRYLIVYHKAESSFAIAINNNPLGIARQAAEKDFLEKLAITENQACQLSVSVGVPVSVNEDAAGVEYYLSFCPNSIPLP